MKNTTKGNWEVIQYSPNTFKIKTNDKGIISFLADVHADQRIYRRHSIPIIEAQNNAILMASSKKMYRVLKYISGKEKFHRSTQILNNVIHLAKIILEDIEQYKIK